MASVGSSASFDSLPEEDETDATSESSVLSSTARPPLLRRSVSPTQGVRPVSFASRASARPPNPKRNSLPSPPAFDGSYRSFSLSPPALTRSSSRGRSSPLGREPVDVEAGAERDKERAKREDRRWKIAEELRETERAYVEVLGEIDIVSCSFHPDERTLIALTNSTTTNLS